jgi:hypothetical protein
MQLSELITIADNCLSRAISGGGNQVIHDDDPVQEKNPVETNLAMVSASETEDQARAVFVEKQPSTPPNSGHFHHNEDMEVEEIEIFTTEYPYTHFGTETHRTAEIQCRSEAGTEPASNTFAGPVSGEAAFAPAAANEVSGVPASPISTPPPTEWAVVPADPEENNADSEMSSTGDNEDMTVVLAPLFGDTTTDQSAAAPADASRMQPKNRQGTIKPARSTKRPGVLKRMLVTLGLARSRK